MGGVLGITEDEDQEHNSNMPLNAAETTYRFRETTLITETHR
jgi:hypothetical protein